MRIEANGDEAQDDELQEYKAHAPDSGGENRSQLRVSDVELVKFGLWIDIPAMSGEQIIDNHDLVSSG